MRGYRARPQIDPYYVRTHTVLMNIALSIDEHRLNRISYWGAPIIHSARQAGCSILLTEGLQPGQTIDSVRMVNPFL